MFGFLKSLQTRKTILLKLERIERDNRETQHALGLALDLRNRAVRDARIYRDKMLRQRKQLRQLQRLYNAFRIGQSRPNLTKEEAKAQLAAQPAAVNILPYYNPIVGVGHPDELRDPQRAIGAVTTDLPFKLVDGKPVPFAGEAYDER